jgi:Holliday junction DNA helicase RuvA
VELRDKLGKQSLDQPAGMAVSQTVDTDAVNALIALGIGRVMAEQAIKKTMTNITANTSLEDIIKQALKNL